MCSLSFAGRCELLISVLYGMIQHWLVFKLNVSTIGALQACSLLFFREAKPLCGSGEDICLQKCERGLGLRKLDELNKAFDLKILWRLLTTDSCACTFIFI